MGLRYRRLVLSFPARLEDQVSAALWRAGTLGCSVAEEGGHLVATAWFDSEATVPDPRFGLSQVSLVSDTGIGEEDWLEGYRRAAQPRWVGRRVWVDPGEERTTPTPAGAIALHLPARTAFGTGSHETTRLMVAALEEADPAGRSVLDVGCGSGILTLAATGLGARLAVGVEIDAQAAFQAGANAERNGYRVPLVAGSVSALGDRRRFDLVLVNILPAAILASATQVARQVAHGGRLHYAGFLIEQRDEIAAAWGAAGLVVEAERREGEWGLLVLARAPGRTAP